LANTSESVQCRPLEVQVGDKGIERAIKHLKRKMAAEGILRELKRRRHYMKPSIKRRNASHRTRASINVARSRLYAKAGVPAGIAMAGQMMQRRLSPG